MSTTPLSTTPFDAATRPADRPTWGTTGRGALLGGVGAVVAALVVYAVANLGAPVQVITGWAPDGADLTVAEVLITTIVAVAFAALGLAVLERVAASGLRIWTIAVAAVTVLSVLPLWRLDLDTGSKVALTIMHLVVGSATIAGQRSVRSTR